jgi:hypothetical protein
MWLAAALGIGCLLMGGHRAGPPAPAAVRGKPKGRPRPVPRAPQPDNAELVIQVEERILSEAVSRDGLLFGVRFKVFIRVPRSGGEPRLLIQSFPGPPMEYR